MVRNIIKNRQTLILKLKFRGVCKLIGSRTHYVAYVAVVGRSPTFTYLVLYSGKWEPDNYRSGPQTAKVELPSPCPGPTAI